MFDRPGIYERFAESYSATYAELAVILNVTDKTTHNWKVGRFPIPWFRLKEAVDKHGLTWDWLIEGNEPKHRKGNGGCKGGTVDRHGINQRFLSLFPDMSQAAIARELGINQTTVFKWCHDLAQVPWERLKYAVDTKGVTWEWLLEGRE